MATEDNKRKYTKRPNNMMPPSENGRNNEPRKKPKLSIYWVWGILGVIIIGYNLMAHGNSSGAEIDNTRFYEMLRRGDVDRIKIVGNRKIVRVTIDPQRLKADSGNYYHKILGNAYNDVSQTVGVPQVYFSIVKDDVFANQLFKFYQDNPGVRQVPEKAGDEGELFGQIVSTLFPILLIALIFIMMMRKVGGGGGTGGPGGIFNIGKSKATLFEKGTRVSINFSDVAGLDEA